MLRHIVHICLLLFLVLQLRAEDVTFRVLGSEQGLRGRHVYQIMCLADGSIVVDTEIGVNVWNGTRFQSVRRSSADYFPLPGYKEFTRLFVDKSDRLWIKDTGKAACLDLRRHRFLTGCDRLLGNPIDFYVDGAGDVWTVTDSVTVRLLGANLRFSLPVGSGRVQDVQTDNRKAYVFTSSGAVSIYDRATGDRLRTCAPYDSTVAKTLNAFSLVVRGADGIFYQIRMGWGHAVVLSFNPKDCKFNKYLDVDYALHTLIVSQGSKDEGRKDSSRKSQTSKLYISCAKGYWVIDLATGEQHLLTQLRLPDGSTVSTGFNTICQDGDGGFWLGSYDDGVLYASPEAGIFDTPGSALPWIAAIAVVVVAVAAATVCVKRKRKATAVTEVATPRLSSQEQQFLDKARHLVEQNLANTGYSVEMLAADLFMERSGLYKKMTAMIGESPVAFIRSVRLEHAAALLAEGGRTVSEVSELAGFSSPQYFNKCFQQKYGCRPSEYAARQFAEK